MSGECKRVVCPWCGATYSTALFFRYIIYTCPTCGKKYKLAFDQKSMVKVVMAEIAMKEDDV